MKYFIIGDEDTVIGFGMVGVKGERASTPDEAVSAFDQAIGTTDIGIIIITERCADMIRERVNRYLFTHEFPLIVEIPDRSGRDPDKPGLREMVNQAIGIHV